MSKAATAILVATVVCVSACSPTISTHSHGHPDLVTDDRFGRNP